MAVEEPEVEAAADATMILLFSGFGFSEETAS